MEILFLLAGVCKLLQESLCELITAHLRQAMERVGDNIAFPETKEVPKYWRYPAAFLSTVTHDAATIKD